MSPECAYVNYNKRLLITRSGTVSKRSIPQQCLGSFVQTPPYIQVAGLRWF